MIDSASRRDFLKTTTASVASALAVGLWTGPSFAQQAKPNLGPFKLSLAEWSLHKLIFDGKLDNLDFAKVSQEEFGIGGVEYVNQFWKDKAKDTSYLNQLKQRAADHDVKSLLIMIDGEGQLGSADEKKRTEAIENHFKWIDAASHLGCHSIRVNAASSGEWWEQLNYAADGLRRLTEHAAKQDINVIVENHGGLSSNGTWLTAVMRQVDHDRCGTLPDFGNFGVDREEGVWYDRYRGTEQLMPFAKAVSAKTYDFDESKPYLTVDPRWEQQIDYPRILKIVKDAGYEGYVGIEYEGGALGEMEGIKKSKELIERSMKKILG